MNSTVIYNGMVFHGYTWDYEKQLVIGKRDRHLKPNVLKYGRICTLIKDYGPFTVNIDKLAIQMDILKKKKEDEKIEEEMKSKCLSGTE